MSRVTHEVDDQLFRFEVLLHFIPNAVRLQLADPFLLLRQDLFAEDSLTDLLLRQLVPLQLLHLGAWLDELVLAS